VAIKFFYDAGHKLGELHTLLSDAGVYSYAAICALALHELFDNEWDQKFNLQCIKLILEHLHLPKQVIFHFNVFKIYFVTYFAFGYFVTLH
jgi:hypothetical protein